jgi:hypothetical protein
MDQNGLKTFRSDVCADLLKMALILARDVSWERDGSRTISWGGDRAEVATIFEITAS